MEPDDHALGYSRGGLTTKIHILCDSAGHPLFAHLSRGQAHEASQFLPLLEGADAYLFDSKRQPLPWPSALAGDKAYRAKWIDDLLLGLDIEPVIPSKNSEVPGIRDVVFDPDAYRQRNIVERLIGWLKESRRLSSRFEKTATNFLAVIKWAFVRRYLRLEFGGL